jgi:TRAP-type C4-dicarboxylate transport system permease small subunit
MGRLKTLFERLLEIFVMLIMVGLTALVILAVFYRKAGASFSWYDEVAAIMLAWLTYYGAALAALKRAHIGFDAVAEIFVIAFFIILAWQGWVVVQVLEGSTLISLTFVPVQLTQSVIPIGAALFILAELISLPGYWRHVRAGVHGEIPSEVGITEHAEAPGHETEEEPR